MNSKFVIGKTDLLITAARTALNVRVNRNSFATLIAVFAEMLIHLQKIADEMERQIYLVARNDDCFWKSVELLTSIPGVGRYSAIVILAEIGDFSRFSKPKQLSAFAGMGPAVKQSGKSLCTHNKLTKRGSPYLRSILDTCIHVAVHPGKNHLPASPVLAEYYEEKRRSKPGNVAMCACIHKLLGYIFAVLRNRIPFEMRSPEEHLAIMRTNSVHEVA